MLTEYEIIIDKFELIEKSLRFFSNEVFVKALDQRIFSLKKKSIVT